MNINPREYSLQWPLYFKHNTVYGTTRIENINYFAQNHFFNGLKERPRWDAFTDIFVDMFLIFGDAKNSQLTLYSRFTVWSKACCWDRLILTFCNFLLCKSIDLVKRFNNLYLFSKNISGNSKKLNIEI